MSTIPLRDDLHMLYSEHHGWLHGWLRRRLGNGGNGGDAADLAHDTFVRVLARHDVLAADADPDDADSGTAATLRADCRAPSCADTAVNEGAGLMRLRSPRAYLGTIARGLLADFFRRKDVERAYLEALAALPDVHQPSPETRAILLEALIAIDAMLDGLKPQVRQAFLLSQLDGLTYDAIARELGVTTRTVSNYMCKAIEHCCLLAP